MFDLDTQILIVDDMITMRKIVSKACGNMGYKKIVTASNGEEAWEIIEKADPQIQLIISDWNMPKLTGLELLKKVRSDEKTKKLPFLLLTAEAEEVQVKEAILCGVDNYVVKPFSSNTLRDKLEVVYNRFKARV